jgi:hypothetical protein
VDFSLVVIIQNPRTSGGGPSLTVSTTRNQAERKSKKRKEVEKRTLDEDHVEDKIFVFITVRDGTKN